MVTFSKKGSILVAFIFIIVLTLVTASFLIMIGGRSAFTTNQLKRAQAINYAEAALYEAFNRFRAGVWDPTEADATFNPKSVTIDGVQVTITKSGTTPPHQIFATVNYNNITM